jgi:hypothetical protein
MTSATKSIWLVISDSINLGKRSQRVAANNFKDVLSYFNDEGQKNIIEVRKLDEEITYHY